MTKNVFRGMVVAVAIAFASLIAGDALAQCCGGGTAAYYQPTTAYYQPTTAYYQPTTAYYQPTAYTAAYAPTYQTYRPMFGGWYPGRFLGRINRAIWGVPETYATAYPTTYAASYPATYSASYPATYTASYPTYTASYAPSYSVGYATSYAAPACTTCAPACTTCAMPCTSCCDPCATCGVATSSVTQAGYEQSSDCPNCAPTYTSQPAQPRTETAPSTYENREPQPAIPADSNVPEQREEVQRQPTDQSDASGTNNGLEPVPVKDNATEVEESSTRLEAPPLFLNPQDRTAQRSPAPVRNAVLHRSASHASLSAAPISWQQAQQDAAGWVSASE